MTLSVWQRTIVNTSGDVLGSASVTVRRESDNALATLYDNPAGTGSPLTNPLIADSVGFVRFYTANDRYNITATSGSFSATWRHVQLGTAQSVDADQDLQTTDSVEFAALTVDDVTIDANTISTATGEDLTLAPAGDLIVSSNVTVTGDLTLAGDVAFTGSLEVDNLRLDGSTISSTTTGDNLTLSPLSGVAEVDGDLLPGTDGTYDLGSPTLEWQNLYIDGIASIDSLVADTADINGGSIDGTTIGASTRAAGNFTTLNANGNVTLGDASTDTVTVNGYIGVGGAPNSAVALRVGYTFSSGSSLYGVVGAPTGPASATSFLIGVSGAPATAAAAFTANNTIGLYAPDHTKGAGSTITNQHGVYIADQTQGTNNYGITSLVSSGSNKWNIYASGTAANYFAGKTFVSTTTDQDGRLVVRSTGNSYANSGVAIVDSANTTKLQMLQTTSGFFYMTVNGTDDFVLKPTEVVFNEGGNDYDFRVESDTNTHALFVEGSSGNVGIGTTPRNWSSIFCAVQVGSANYFSFASQSTAAARGSILWNAYGTGDETFAYNKTGDSASRFTQQYDFRWETAPSGTIGNTVTFTERAKITATEMVVNDPGNDYDFRVESDTSTHALFVRGSDGNVGIGTSSPEQLLNIAGVSGTAVISLERTNTGAGGGKGAIGWKSPNGYFTAAISEITDAGSNDGGGLIFRAMSGSTTTNAYSVTERLRITSDGYLRMASGTGGIQFNGDTAAANALDDYEEGTFTPTVAGDATGAFGSAEGYYTKIGRLVFIELYFTVSTNFTSNTVGGLPFTVANLAAGTSFGQSAVVLTNAADTVTGAAQETTTNAVFYNDHNLLSAHAPNTTNSAYRLSMCYQST